MAYYRVYKLKNGFKFCYDDLNYEDYDCSTIDNFIQWCFDNRKIDVDYGYFINDYEREGNGIKLIRKPQ